MRLLYYVVVFVGGLVAQWIWSTYWPVWELGPQLLLVLTVALAAREGPILSATFAFLWGLFGDVMRVHLFGSEALLLTCVAYGVGLVRRQLDLSSPLPQAMLLGAISIAYYPALAVIGLLWEGHAFWAGWKQFLLTPAYNCAVSPLGFVFIERFTQKHEY
jgi:rod shape-determining protein MreD